MTVGRNDPCPCGSGKKYKKCCGPRDEQTRQAELGKAAGAGFDEDLLPRAPSESLRGGPLLPPTRSEVAQPAEITRQPDTPQDVLWEKFEKEGHEGKISLFLENLENPDLIDGESVFEMVDDIGRGMRERGEWERFEELVRTVEQRRPDVYQEEAAYLVSLLIDAAIAQGRVEELPPLGRQLAAASSGHIDIFSFALDAIRYHAQLALLTEMMRVAWPGVRGDPDVLPWAVEDFQQDATRFEILAYCQQATAPRADAPELIERLKFYEAPVDEEWVRLYLDHVTGRAEQKEMPAIESQGHGSRGRRELEAMAIWCRRLCIEFLGRLHQQRQVSYPRADLAVDALLEYLFERLRGGDDDEEPSDRARRPARKGDKGSKPRPKTADPSTVFCPDRATLEPFLARKLGFLSSRCHSVAALMEAVPAWLEFIESRGLLAAGQRVRAFDDLSRLRDDVAKAWKDSRQDPALLKNLDVAWSTGPREGS